MLKSFLIQNIKNKDSLLIIIFLISGLTIFGWIINDITLTSFSLKYIPIAPSTTIIFIILSILLLIIHNIKESQLIRIIVNSLIIILIIFCITILIDFLFDLNWDIENNYILNFSGDKNNMSPITAIMFVLNCISILISRQNKIEALKYAGGTLSLLTGTIASVLLIGYLYKAPLLYGSEIIPVSLPAALCFFLFSITLLRNSELKYWTYNLIKEDKVVRKLLGNFLPIVIFIVVLEGFLVTNISFNLDNPALSESIILLIVILITVFVIIKTSTFIGVQLLSAEEAMRESEIKFSNLFDNMEQGVAYHKIVYDKNGIPVNYIINDLNHSYEIQTGIARKLAKGKTATELYQTETPPFFKEYTRVAETGIPYSFEIYFEPIKKHFQIHSFSNKKGYFYILFSDITVRKLGEQSLLKLNLELEQRVYNRTKQLENTNKELESFAYSVAHDLRSPLRAIDGFSKIIYEDYYSKFDEEGRRLLNIIQDNAKKMDNLIIDLLSLSKVTRAELNRIKIDMKTLAFSVYNEISDEEIKNKFSITIHSMPDAIGDTVLMKQLWTNLISNAIKYTMPKDECKIEIGFSNANGSDGYYYIKDTGVGFNPEYKHKLFGVFQRLHSAKEFEGTGIGLSIVEKIVARHGGNVWGESVLNEGATFYFNLDCSQK